MNKVSGVIMGICLFLLVYTPSVIYGATIDLYDNSLGSLPQEQEWLIHAGTSDTDVLVDVSGTSYTSLDTLQDVDYREGFSNYLAHNSLLFPVLDRSLGFSVEFELQMIDEFHNSNDRAGFSIILLSSDSFGIELGFWTDEIWEQQVGFSHGTKSDFNTTDEVVTYTLNILNDQYRLMAGNVNILSDALKKYNSPFPPYGLGSYLFLGDNTTSARAQINLGKITLWTSEVPEPGSLLLLGVGLIGMAYINRKS